MVPTPLAGYSHQDSFIKAKSLHGATCEEVIKTSGNQKIRSRGDGEGAMVLVTTQA